MPPTRRWAVADRACDARQHVAATGGRGGGRGGGGGGAVMTNRGWDTNAILGHVDPHSVTESACAGSHTQMFPTNLCG